MRKPLHMLALALVAAGLAACNPLQVMSGKSGEESEANRPEPVAIPVEAQYPVLDDIADYLDTTSWVEAERQVQVTSEGSGRCVEILVEEGDVVRRGDVLVELDKSQALAQLRQTEVQVRKQKADYERVRRSREEDGNLIFTQEDWDVVRYAYEQGLANLEMQQIQLDNLTIRAPISGVVTQRFVNLGQLVGAGAPVVNIVDPDSFVLVINPSQQDLPRLRVGQDATVSVDALGGQTFNASIRRINPTVDPQSGTVKVLLDFPEERRNQLREGAFARVQLATLVRHDALLVPRDAVLEESGRRYVFLVREEERDEDNDENGEAGTATETSGSSDDGGDGPAPEKAEPRLVATRVEVETGLGDGHRVEITNGLTLDDLVVTVGQHALREGAPVRLATAEEELAGTSDITVEEALAAAREKRDAGGVQERNRPRRP